MAALIEVQNLKKYFETPRGTLHAVDDVSFKIDGKLFPIALRSSESPCGLYIFESVFSVSDKTGTIADAFRFNCLIYSIILFCFASS